MSNSKKIILFGAGGHAKSCIDVIEQGGYFKIMGLVGLQSELGQHYLGHSVIADDTDTESLSTKYTNALVSVGQMSSADVRERIFRHACLFNFSFPVIISPHASVSRHALIGQGTIIMHGAVVNAGAVIGENCIVNTQCIVEHDAVVGDHCHLSTRATLNGGVRVGAGSFVGSGAVIREGVYISDRSFIKMGSILTKSANMEINQKYSSTHDA